MDIRYILDQLHEERQRVSEVILILERLTQGIQRRRGLSAQVKKLAADEAKGAGKRGRRKARVNGE